MGYTSNSKGPAFTRRAFVICATSTAARLNEPASTFRFKTHDRCIKQTNQNRKVLAKSSPKYFNINLVVTMDQAIAHTDDLLPRDGWKRGLTCLRNPIGGLTDNLDESGERQ